MMAAHGLSLELWEFYLLVVVFLPIGWAEALPSDMEGFPPLNMEMVAPSYMVGVPLLDVIWMEACWSLAG